MNCPDRVVWYRSRVTALALLLAAAGCSTSPDAPGAGGAPQGQAGTNAAAAGANATTAGTSSVAGAATSSGGAAAATGGAAAATGGNGSGGTSTEGGTTGTAGHAGAAGGGAGGGANGGAAGAGGGGLVSSCTGPAWPTADPAAVGPFAVTADKNVGPLAGAVPDPVYGNMQQKFNVYRPTDLAMGGYCHPILVWANGHTDNPEPNPPDCVVANGKYCGTYPVLINQLASHGFVVIASLSTITSQLDAQANQLPTIIGLDWLIKQADDSTSPYYHHLDTAHIGALGHSEGGFSTSKAASDPRLSAIATVSGSAANPGIHTPSLWLCGGKDTTVTCDSVTKTYATITNQPAMLIDNLTADHGGWLYQNGIKGPDIIAFTAWFRVHLMGDTANRKMFYGPSCTFCTDSRVQVMQNSLMAQ